MQWVLSFPKWVRFHLACNARLATRARQLFVRAVFAHLRRTARAADLARPLVGAVSFEQRFGSTLALNLHYHVVVADGVFVATGRDDALAFHRLPPPTDAEVTRLVARVAAKVLALLTRSTTDEVAQEDDSLIAERHVAAVGRIAVPPATEPHITKPRCAFWNGFSMHADVRIHENDRLALARLCAYVTRPPCPEDRLTRLRRGARGRRPSGSRRSRPGWRGTSRSAMHPTTSSRSVALFTTMLHSSTPNEGRYFSRPNRS